jgi:hypothetical protein
MTKKKGGWVDTCESGFCRGCSSVTSTVPLSPGSTFTSLAASADAPEDAAAAADDDAEAQCALFHCIRPSSDGGKRRLPVR